MNWFYYAIVIIAWNIFVFSMYGIDKSKAKRGSRRISEKTLLVSAVFMGGLGALLGMYVFRHKTKHAMFMIGVPLALIFNIVVVVAIVWYLYCFTTEITSRLSVFLLLGGA